ncbi:MAG: T9SS type A sorting domain-containing protein [Bacteroidota bacterium]
MYIAHPGTSFFTGIYNEGGILIFSDTGAAGIRPNFIQQQFPIYNTSQGTKMILSYGNGQAKVFSLPGTLSDDIAEANNNLIAIQSSSVSNAYPNPTNNTTQIDYTLPPGINEGEIVFYDLFGNEVKRFKVDKTFNTLLVSTADIAVGTYLYQLQTMGDNSAGKKIVVIK